MYLYMESTLFVFLPDGVFLSCDHHLGRMMKSAYYGRIQSTSNQPIKLRTSETRAYLYNDNNDSIILTNFKNPRCY